ncbi:MAG: hypothetical protein AAF772_20575, partial [Acidobacteriota bacterium]
MSALDLPAPLRDDLHPLETTAAVVRLDDPDSLRLVGADRIAYLNGRITCDLAALAAGAGRLGFLTARKGQVLASARVLATDDALELTLPAGQGAAMREHLGTYIVTEDVRIETPSRATFLVIGPDAPAFAAAHLGVDLADADPYAHGPATGADVGA